MTTLFSVQFDEKQKSILLCVYYAVDRRFIFWFLFISTKYDCIYNFLIDFKSNLYPFCNGNQNGNRKQNHISFDLKWDRNTFLYLRVNKMWRFRSENNICLSPFKLKGIWSWWQYFFWLWTKRNPVWFIIKRKIFTTIIFL